MSEILLMLLVVLLMWVHNYELDQKDAQIASGKTIIVGLSAYQCKRTKTLKEE